MIHLKVVRVLALGVSFIDQRETTTSNFLSGGVELMIQGEITATVRPGAHIGPPMSSPGYASAAPTTFPATYPRLSF